jgi:hypothetical protein
MKSDSSLNNMVDNICFDVLPVNFDLNKDQIVYNYRENERIDVLSQKNVMTIYSFYVKVISKDTFKLLNISDEINKFLTGYKSTNVLDIAYSNDDHQNGETEDGTDIYTNTIEYEITYVN